MLKWAVTSKRAEAQAPSRLSLNTGGAPRPPPGPRRRSLGGPSCRRRQRRTTIHDKENVDFIGLAQKELLTFRKLEYVSGALKDVSNLTPKNATPSSIRSTKDGSSPGDKRDVQVYRRFGGDPASRFAVTPTCVPRNLVAAQPFLKKRRILLETDIYVDGADGDVEEDADDSGCLGLENERSEDSTHVKVPSSASSEDQSNLRKELIESERRVMDAVLGESRVSDDKVCIEKTLANCDTTKNTIHASSLPTFEIEYSPCTLGSFMQRNANSYVSEDHEVSACLSTLPVIGSRIFLKNPLYFNMDDFPQDGVVPPSKKLKIDLADNFSSMLDKLSPLSALRQNGCKEREKICSEVSPLARKLASLCFSKIDLERLSPSSRRTDRTPLNAKKRRPIIMNRDEEASIEMETKVISERSGISTDESSISDSKMGDATLEKMIDDILKSTKKVKRARKVKLYSKHSEIQAMTKQVDDVVPKKMSSLDISAIEPCTETPPRKPAPEKIDQIPGFVTARVSKDIPKEATKKLIKSVSFKHTFKRHEKMFEDKTYIELDPLNSSEREVKTPENRLSPKKTGGVETMLKGCLEKFTINSAKKSSRKRCNSLDCTPSHNTSLLHDSDFNFNLKRQRCVRRKRMCNRDDGEETTHDGHDSRESGLTLKTGIPSPYTPDNKSISRFLQSTSFNAITGYPLGSETNTSGYTNNYTDIPRNVSNSSLMLGQYSANKKSSSSPTGSKMFGLTLQCGIPSPASPYSNNILMEDFNINTPGFFSSINDSKTGDDSVDVVSEPVTPVVEFKSSRRCLTYSPEDDDTSMEKRHSELQSGTIDLCTQFRNDQLTVTILRCHDLQRPNGISKHINAYVKVCLTGGTFQRTPVRRDCTSPQFLHSFHLPAPGRRAGRRLHVSVWHRDSHNRRSEFLGCVSFPARHAARRDLVGSYRLQSGARARRPRPPMAAHDDPSDTGAAARLASQQREADEHLFLRYLELDPVEGPDAAPAALQRKASGNKQGRTPFTTTRRLERGNDQGFGFSVLWTRPPRVERVDAGRAAERAGLHPGDYIVFVDRHNVVTLPESQVLTLIKSSGAQLILETFRRSAHTEPRGFLSRARGSLTSHATLSDAPCSPAPLRPLPRLLASDDWPQASPIIPRASTACSNNTATSVASKARPMLPQVAFTRESMTALGSVAPSGAGGAGGAEHLRALQAVVAREQSYTQALQFGMDRYIAPLASRADVITPAEHKLLFQNCEELLRLSEDILEQLVSEDGEIHIHLVASVYLAKMPSIISMYKTYCNGLKRADCVLVQKSRQAGGNFVRLCTEPVVPRRRPDVTQLVHKPLEQFRELLRLLRAARAAATPAHPDQPLLHRLVTDLQNAYHEVTAGAGLMGPLGEGRPLLSVADLESRLVFTRCKPFVLAKPGRQWIFGGDLARVEGRTVRPCWALLFSDLLLFATVSRDRVLFITEEPLPIANITETCFSIRKRANEFRLGVGQGRAGSPTARCGPPARTRTRALMLRAPSSDLKAVWQSLLLRQILRLNSSTGTPLSSPMESPAPLGCYSEVTLDSQQRQKIQTENLFRNHANNNVAAAGVEAGAAGAEAKARACKGAALHLARWMRSHPGSGPLEPDPEIWSTEQLRKRSRELRLIDVAQAISSKPATANVLLAEKSPSEVERSPSRSTNSDSQITVRSSPVVPETVPVCRQCHKRCFSKPGSPQISAKTPTPCDKQNHNSPLNNGLLPSTYTCQTKHAEVITECATKCANVNCIPETKIIATPEKVIINNNINLNSVNNNTPEPERVSPSIANRRSREEFFKSTYISKDNNNPLDRSSKSPSPRSPCSQRSDSSRSTLYSTNSPLSYAHTTCSSMVLSTSTGKKSLSPGRDSNASGGSGVQESVQCVIAQEKYLNEVKCVENILLSKSPNRVNLKDMGKLYMNAGKLMGDKISASKVNQCLGSETSVFNTDRVNSSFIRREGEFFSSAVKATVNGDIRKDLGNNRTGAADEVRTASEFSWGPMMLMGLTGINPAAQLLAMDSKDNRSPAKTTQNQANSVNSPAKVPNISVVPPTPDYKADANCLERQHTLEDSPDDSPIAEEPPYLVLKRYGTMSSLERLPSDEIDDAQLNIETEVVEKDTEAAPGLLGWTARAGSYVVEKMAMLNSLAESGAASTGASFLERYLGAGEWRTVRPTGCTEAEGGEGSGASGEEAWGTPSSGDLSDHAFPDSDHATLSSPTKSSSSCPGDEDTELMMDELLMTPPLAGPSLRPLLPRRRLEPLLEEDGSDTSSSSGEASVTPSPSTDQGSAAADEQRAAPASPDRTPTNPQYPMISSPPAPDSVSTCSWTASEGTEEGGCGAAGQAEGEGLSPRMEMRLALAQGRDMLAEQELEHQDQLEQPRLWDRANARCAWVRRPLRIPQHQLSQHATQNITSNSSASVLQGGAAKVTAMERLALMEARGARRGGRRPRPTARLMGLVRRRASSDSPERRPYSPRRQQHTVSSRGYYKICFVNGFV